MQAAGISVILSAMGHAKTLLLLRFDCWKVLPPLSVAYLPQFFNILNVSTNLEVSSSFQ